jgi:translation initiation factor 3 subunit M
MSFRFERILSKAGLDKAALEKKMRLIALTALASTRVGKEISYARIAQEIEIPESDVEAWVIQSQSFRHSLSSGVV